MELNRDNKESWLFCISEALEAYKNRCLDMCQPQDIARLGEITTAMTWIEKELNPLLSFTDEKIALIQKKDLLQQLYIMTNSASEQLSPEENAQIADMILKRNEQPIAQIELEPVGALKPATLTPLTMKLTP